MKKVIKKLTSHGGLTLTEMLVTMLILTMFSSAALIGITTAFTARRESIKYNDAEVLASLLTNFITNELRTATNIEGLNEPDLIDQSKVDGVSQITYQSNESNYKKVVIKVKDYDDDNKSQLFLIIKGADGNKEMPAYNPAAYSDQKNFRLKISKLEFKWGDKEKTSVRVSLAISDSESESDDDAIATANRDFTIGLLNSQDTSPGA